MHDPVKTPKHYTSHRSGVECIDITKHMNFCLGNALKYIWRADLKFNAIEDLEKAREYLLIEINRRKKLESEEASGGYTAQRKSSAQQSDYTYVGGDEPRNPILDGGSRTVVRDRSYGIAPRILGETGWRTCLRDISDGTCD